MNDNYLKELATTYTEEILPPFDTLISLVGYDAICKMADMLGGSAIYIPTKKRIFNGCIRQQILKDFDGTNYKELARKFGYCERTVRSILEK